MTILSDSLGYFVLPGESLAGMAAPRGVSSFDELAAELRDAGVVAIVTLTEEPLDEVSQAGLSLPCLHVPVIDYGAPSPMDVDKVAAFVARFERGTVLVHCRSGIGRTGTMLACLLVKRGRAGEEAIDEVRRAKPAAINSQAQERFIKAYQSD